MCDAWTRPDIIIKLGQTVLDIYPPKLKAYNGDGRRTGNESEGLALAIAIEPDDLTGSI